MPDRTILTTGASGLLGSHLLPLLAGDRVVTLSRPAADLSRPIDPALLPNKIDAVVYLAQSRRFREFPNGADDVFQVNVAQPLALLAHAQRAGATHFVYASTGGVYAPSDAPLTEKSPLAEPMPFYPASKRAAELVIQAYASHLNVIILRFFFIYGAGQTRGMLVPRLVDSIRNGHRVELQGSEGIRINPIHVADAARAVCAALELAQSATINVAGPDILSIRAISETIGNHLSISPLYRFASTHPSLVADTALMRRLLFTPEHRFEDMLAEICSE